MKNYRMQDYLFIQMFRRSARSINARKTKTHRTCMHNVFITDDFVSQSLI